MTDREKAIKICECIDLPAELGAYSEDEEPDFLDFLYDEIPVEFGHFRIEHGATKGVLVFDDLPFVIKFPFNGMLYYNGDYDPEQDDEDNEYYFESFYGADGSERDNYCQSEFERTLDIMDAGFMQFVPQIDIIYKDKYGRKFYIQEKVKPFNELGLYEFSPSENSMKCASNMQRGYCKCDVSWRANVVEKYGEETWVAFVDWVDNTDMHLWSDMHYGNFGYRLDGTPVIFDISGYND